MKLLVHTAAGELILYQAALPAYRPRSAVVLEPRTTLVIVKHQLAASCPTDISFLQQTGLTIQAFRTHRDNGRTVTVSR
jgi:hypothetical protein